MAVRCGSAVEALSERTEYTQTKINPSGTATLTSAVEPQRARRADWSWTAVDTALRADSDGSRVPAATLAGVRFSGGGAGPMVTWRDKGSTFTLSWPRVYDPAAGTIRVFVMGDVQTCGGDQNEATFGSSWSATGRFVIGHANTGGGGASSEWLTASADKVHAHQRALANIEICQMVLQ
jgi:hypothetical protein